MQIFERALIVVGQPNDELNVYGENGYTERVKQNISYFIDRKCRYFGSDIATATLCVKDKLDVRKNVPICPCTLRKIVFFKIECSITNQPIWFRYSPKMKYRRIDDNRNGIFLENNLIIPATFSRHKFDAQTKRVKAFIKSSLECANCTQLSCVNCSR
jgi:competence transcription factor ComK